MQGFGMGRYVPPDQEGLVSGNERMGVRAQKANADGVPIVRFEMPFAVWCDGCEARTLGRDGKHHPVLIGQGVRFNAEKHRSGNYYTTPIWTFRMRHPACGTWLAIRTDPATTSYVVVEGGRRRREYDDDEDEDNDDGGDGARAAGDSAVDEGSRLSAFDRLERTIVHREVASTAAADAASAAHRLGALEAHSARQWDDPYARNRALRAAFRAGRHAREQAAADDAALRRRLGGLSDDLALLPATDRDARLAALVDFGSRTAAGGAETPREVVDRRVLAQPLFGVSAGDALPRPHCSGRSRNVYAPTTEAARRQQSVREHLAATVLANTRMKTDPFVLALSGKASGTTAAAAAASSSASASSSTPVRSSPKDTARLRRSIKRSASSTDSGAAPTDTKTASTVVDDPRRTLEDTTSPSRTKRKRDVESKDAGDAGNRKRRVPADGSVRAQTAKNVVLVNYDSD